MRDKIHVVPDGDGGWDVKRENVSRAANNFENKADAVDRAKEMAKSSGGPSQVLVHGKDGKIQYENTYKKDPEKYPG